MNTPRPGHRYLVNTRPLQGSPTDSVTESESSQDDLDHPPRHVHWQLEDRRPQPGSPSPQASSPASGYRSDRGSSPATMTQYDPLLDPDVDIPDEEESYFDEHGNLPQSHSPMEPRSPSPWSILNGAGPDDPIIQQFVQDHIQACKELGIEPLLSQNELEVR